MQNTEIEFTISVFIFLLLRNNPPIYLLLLLHRRVTFAAIYRSVVSGLEGNTGFVATVSAYSREELLLCLTGVLSCIAASLASLRLVLETSFCIELLLAGSEGELLSAVLTLQNLVFVHFATSL